jgi:hypothetical protein
MKDEPVVGDGSLVHRDVPLQVLLYGQGSGALGKPQPMRYPENVGIYGNHGLVIDYGGNHVGGFAAHAGETHQRVYIGGDGATIIGLQHLSHGNEVTGFGVGVRDAFHIGIDFLKSGGRQLPGRWKALKERRGDQVHPLVRALGAKYHGNK